MKDVSKILSENTRRMEEYFRSYDPVIGDSRGEVTRRFPLKVGETTLYLPDAMRDEPLVNLHLRLHTTNSVAQKLGRTSEEIIEALSTIRLDYDFEYFAYVCTRIEDKQSGRLIPFALNAGQRRLVKHFETQRLEGIPIRMLLVKARQFGGSTVIVRYIQWLQLHVRKGWHSAIISALQDQALNLRSDYESAISDLPAFHPHITYRGLGASQTIKYIPQRRCKIKITSAEKPGALRSFSMKALHMTECGNWPATTKKTGNELAQAAYTTVPDEKDTFIALESTALGVGNFFYKQYCIAKANLEAGRQGLVPVFVPFFIIKYYRLKIKDYKSFISSMNEYDWILWNRGATLESIAWYDNYKASSGFTEFQMKSEYPSTADEAFQSNSGRYFSDKVIAYLRSSVREPVFTGDIRGDSAIGEAALSSLHLIENDSYTSEVLKIWIMPNDMIDPRKEKVTYRYIVTVDIGGRHWKSDWSVISVFDRMGLMNPGGALERAALWRGHIDHDLLAWKAAQIARFYNNALLVIESNTIDSRDKKRDYSVESGDHFYTVLDEIKPYYSNMYMRESAPDSMGRTTLKIGFQMNVKTKYQIYDKYAYMCREAMYVEHSDQAADEAGYLENKAGGEIGNIEGQHDDIQDTTATASYIATRYESFPLPAIIPVSHPASPSMQRKGGLANF